jgi:PAS domain S-box-containing protein
MKIRQKLTVGFVGASLLVGAIGGFSFIVNQSLYSQINRIKSRYIHRAEFASQIISNLQNINLETHELIAEEIHGHRRQNVVSNIQNELNIIEQYLKNEAVIMQQSLDETKSRNDAAPQELVGERQIVDNMTREFSTCEKLLNEYLEILSNNSQDPKSFLAQKLELHIEKTLLPIVQSYDRQAKTEFLHQTEETEDTILILNRAIIFSTLVAVAIAIVLGYLISRSIVNPIDKLTAAAIAIGKGHLGTKVAIDSQDELGILADAFNQMTVGLSQKTVSQFYLDKVLGSMPDSLIVTNPERVITKVNRATLDILGFTEDEMIGKSIDLFLVQDTSLSVCTLAERGFNLNLEINMLTIDGRLIPVFFSSSTILDEQGNKQGLVCVARDITDKKKIEAALLRVKVAEAAKEEIDKALQQEKHLNEMKTKFIAMASHEFRTPLTTILSSSELLRDYSHKWTEERKNQHFQRIASCVKHMTELLNDVLLIGKAEADKIEFNPSSIDVVNFCRELVEEIEIISKDCKILFQCKRQYIHACMDEKLLRHIFTNLLSNAIKYSPKGGTINFELIFQLENLIFQIRDCGIGIPPTELSQLFNTFHRASNVGTIQGTGLGLAIVKKSVEAHQGKITVESEVGVGTTFQVALPLYEVCPSRD